jgi:aldehyde:ferredoxin oxidoreductase
MLDEYYELHKWNKKSGEIPKKRLKELDILI